MDDDKKLVTKPKYEVPKLAELYENTDLVRKSNDLNVILNSPPNEKWIKKHPIAKGVKYLPIEVVEYLLTNVFVRWRVEIRETQLVANSVVVTVRLHVLDPVTGEWDFQDGIGANPIQTDSGAAATDFTKVKSSAVMQAAPAAESFAVKDAAEKFGKLFGKDLNRKDELAYSRLLDMSEKLNEITDITEIEDNLASIDNIDELNNYFQSLDPEMRGLAKVEKAFKKRSSKIS